MTQPSVLVTVASPDDDHAGVRSDGCGGPRVHSTAQHRAFTYQGISTALYADVLAEVSRDTLQCCSLGR